MKGIMGEDPELGAVPGILGCVVVLVRGLHGSRAQGFPISSLPSPLFFSLPITHSSFSTCAGMRSNLRSPVFFLPHENMLLSSTQSLLSPVSEGKASLPLSRAELLTWAPDGLPPGAGGWSSMTSSPLLFGPSASPLSLMVLVLAGSDCYKKTAQTGWLKQQTIVSHGSGSWEVQVQGQGAGRSSIW